MYEADYEGLPGSLALLATCVIVLVGVILVIAVTAIAGAIGGPILALVTALAAQVAMLTYATTRAYPPDQNAPMIKLLVVTILFSIVLPLAYLTWLSLTKKKWAPTEAVS
jgi:hypothetical protein